MRANARVHLHDAERHARSSPEKRVLEDITLAFYPGAKIGVIGTNGSGKSSLIRIMAGVDTEFIGEAKPYPGTKIGYFAQEPDLGTLKTVKEAGRRGCRGHSRPRHRFRSHQHEAGRADVG